MLSKGELLVDLLGSLLFELAVQEDLVIHHLHRRIEVDVLQREQLDEVEP